MRAALISAVVVGSSCAPSRHVAHATPKETPSAARDRAAGARHHRRSAMAGELRGHRPRAVPRCATAVARARPSHRSAGARARRGHRQPWSRRHQRYRAQLRLAPRLHRAAHGARAHRLPEQHVRAHPHPHHPRRCACCRGLGRRLRVLGDPRPRRHLTPRIVPRLGGSRRRPAHRPRARRRRFPARSPHRGARAPSSRDAASGRALRLAGRA